MADLKAGVLSAPNTRFTQITPRQELDISRDTAAKAVLDTGVLVGKGVARANAADLAGADISLEDVNEELDTINTQMDRAFASETPGIEGPPTARRVEEIKSKTLDEFATNDRVLLGLRDQGTISTIEARARRRLNLQRALSNPINALFRKDFMNAAADLTGGGDGAVNAAFDFTADEKNAMAVQEAVRKETAAVEAEITGVVMRTGKSREVVVAELAEAAKEKDRADDLAAIKVERELTQVETEEGFDIIRNNSARGIAASVAERVTANGGKGLLVGDMVATSQTIEQTYQSALEQLNLTTNVSSTWKDLERQRLATWKSGMESFVKTYDQASIDTAEIEQLEAIAGKLGWKHAGELMAIKAIDPSLYTLVLQSGGNIDKFLNRTLGGERGTKFVDATKLLGTLSSFSTKYADESPDGLMTFLDSPEGIDYIESEEVKSNPIASSNLKNAYLNATEESLKTYNRHFSTRTARTSERLQNEIVAATDIARRKMTGIRSSLVTQNLEDPRGAITITQKFIPGSTPGTQRLWSTTLNLPDAMEGNKNEIREIYEAVKKHTWAWEHVSDQYFDAADAFNGFMRGDWDFTSTIAPEGGAGGKADRGGRIETEAPVTKTPFSATIPEGRETTVAIENNNPGNLRALGIPFEGKTGEVDTDSGKFSRFESPEMGMRALARDLDTKIKKGTNTIQKIIEVYSPDADPQNIKRGFTNQNYIEFVVREMNLSPNKELTSGDRAALMEAIIKFESGFLPWSPAVIQEGIRLADKGNE